MQRERLKDGTTVLRGGNAGNDFDHRTVNNWNVNYNITNTALAAFGNAVNFNSRGVDDKFKVTFDYIAGCTAGAPVTLITQLMLDGVAYGRNRYVSMSLNYWGIATATQIFTGIPAGAHYFQQGAYLFAAGTCLILGADSCISIERLN